MDFYKLAKKSIASQDPFELWQLLEILNRLQPERIVEIGVHRGGMVQTLAEAFPDANIVGVDIDFSELEFTGFTRIQGDSGTPQIRDKVSLELRYEQIDFLFIDGDHSYDGITRDFEMYAPLVRSGGIIGFHDIHRDPARVPHHVGVDSRRHFDEVKKKHANIEIWNGAAGDDGPGIGLLFV